MITIEEAKKISYVNAKLNLALDITANLLSFMNFLSISQNPYPNHKPYSQLDGLKRMKEYFDYTLMQQDMYFEEGDEDKISENNEHMLDFINKFFKKSYEYGPFVSDLSKFELEDLDREFIEAYDILKILNEFDLSHDDSATSIPLSDVELLHSYLYKRLYILKAIEDIRNDNFENQNGTKYFDKIPSKNIDILEKFLQPYITEDFAEIEAREK